ncbi:MAG: hypothetical protein FWC43_00960 [Planctomycetaceae bacterium]|nr:hypothetical protein [Planctomycetaceae bacterium]
MPAKNSSFDDFQHVATNRPRCVGTVSLGNTTLMPEIATLGRFSRPVYRNSGERRKHPKCGRTFDSKTYCMAHAFLSTSSRTHLGMGFDVI